MRHIVTDRVEWSVSLSVTLVSPAKTAEPIKMPLGLRTQLGPGNHVLDRGSDHPTGRGNSEGEGASHCKVYRNTLQSSVQKTAESIKMPFGLWGRMGPGNHVLDGGSRSPMGRGNFKGEGEIHCKV